MLLKLCLPPQSARQMKIESTTFVVAEVVAYLETDAARCYYLNPEYLRHVTNQVVDPSMLRLIVKTDSLVLELESEDIIEGEVLLVESVQEVSNYPAVQHRYKK